MDGLPTWSGSWRPELWGTHQWVHICRARRAWKSAQVTGSWRAEEEGRGWSRTLCCCSMRLLFWHWIQPGWPQHFRCKDSPLEEGQPKVLKETKMEQVDWQDSEKMFLQLMEAERQGYAELQLWSVFGASLYLSTCLPKVSLRLLSRSQCVIHRMWIYANRIKCCMFSVRSLGLCFCCL